MERIKPEQDTWRRADVNGTVDKEDKACEDGITQKINCTVVVARFSSFKNGMRKEDLG